MAPDSDETRLDAEREARTVEQASRLTGVPMKDAAQLIGAARCLLADDRQGAGSEQGLVSPPIVRGESEALWAGWVPSNHRGWFARLRARIFRRSKSVVSGRTGEGA